METQQQKTDPTYFRVHLLLIQEFKQIRILEPSGKLLRENILFLCAFRKSKRKAEIFQRWITEACNKFYTPNKQPCVEKHIVILML